MSTEHTPTPWDFSRKADYWRVEKLGINGISEETANCLKKENAEFIVRSVNAHEALLEAARLMLGWLTAEEGQLEQGRWSAPRLDVVKQTIAEIETAIAQAEDK